MEERQKINVEIYGQNYTLRVTPSEEPQVRQIAAHVDAMMHRIGDGQDRLDYRDIAVLSAMNIAEELYRLKKDHMELLNLLDEER